MIKRNEYHRLTLRANNEYRPWEKVTIGHNLSAAFSLKSNDDPAVVGQAYRLSPTVKPYNEEGDFSDSQNSSTGNPLATIAYLNNNTRDLTSSLRTPKFFVKEFSYFLMPCHQHGLRINLLVQR